MDSEIAVRPPNSLVLVVTTDEPDIPESMGGELVASTASALAVGTLSEADGETTVKLTDALSAGDEASLSLVFEGALHNPQGFVRVISVYGDRYLEQHTASREVRLRIWANDASEPDHVVVELQREGSRRRRS